MANKLTTVVTVSDESGRFHTFGPDDELPAWARKAITNPKAFGEPAAEPQWNNGLSAPDRAERVENLSAKADAAKSTN